MIDSVTAIILAGGQARRMGGIDKGLVLINQKPMIEYVLETLQQQTENIIINANRNTEIYQQYGYSVVADDIPDYSGPLSGLASCMKHVMTRYVMTSPCDSPFIPHDLIARLLKQLQQDRAEISVVHDGKRLQPVFSLMKTSLLPSLLDYLAAGEKKIDRWFQQHQCTLCDYKDQADSFMNINTEDDIISTVKYLQS